MATRNPDDPDGANPAAPTTIGRARGVEGHPMQFEEARRRIIDKFGDSEAHDASQYATALAADPVAAAKELAKLHPLVAGQRTPRKPLFRRYAKLLGEARAGGPLDREEERTLRRELVLAPATEEGLSAIRARFG